MDWATIVGTIIGFVIVGFGVGISGIGVLPYLSLSSFFIVLGGSYCAMLIANPLRRMFSIGTYLKLVFLTKDWDYSGSISTLVSLADRARKEGLLALEDAIPGLSNGFMRQGVQLVVDGTDPEVIRSILFSDMGKMQERHEKIQRLFDDWGKISPAFGLIGTVIGLIAMLGSIGGDISIIGRGLQTALVTTFYGALLANLFLIPVRTKLIERDEQESLLLEIIIDGVLSIQSGDNPRVLFEKLVSFLPEMEREEVRRSMSAEWAYGG